MTAAPQRSAEGAASSSFPRGCGPATEALAIALGLPGTWWESATLDASSGTALDLGRVALAPE